MDQPLLRGFDAPQLAARVLATWFGCGKVPVAPGTAGALGAIPVHVVLRCLPAPLHWGAIAGLAALGFWSSQRVADELGVKDPQTVVIDEVVGVLIAMAMVRRRGLGAQVLAFALFRAFDITKPGPIKKAEELQPAGVGIMMDDILAGVFAGLGASLVA